MTLFRYMKVKKKGKPVQHNEKPDIKRETTKQPSNTSMKNTLASPSLRLPLTKKKKHQEQSLQLNEKRTHSQFIKQNSPSVDSFELNEPPLQRRCTHQSVVEQATMKATNKANIPNFVIEWKKKRYDHKKRRPLDVGYDENTIYIPQQEWQKLSEPKKQYWSFKRDHMRDFVLFQEGATYHVYYEDADIVSRELGMKIVAGDHVGFPAQSIYAYLRKIFNIALSLPNRRACVRVISQTEKGKKKGIPDRKVSFIVTKANAGVFMSQASSSSMTESMQTMSQNEYCNYVLYIEKVEKEYHVCAVDMVRSLVYIDKLTSEMDLHNVCLEFQPAEIWFKEATVPSSLKKTVRRMNSELRFKMGTFAVVTLSDLFPNQVPTALQNERLQSTFLNVISQFKQEYNMNIDIIHTWNILSLQQYQRQYMMINGTTMSHLNVIYNEYGTTQGTIYGLFEPHLSTPMGKVRMKEWLQFPLCQIPEIEARYDAIEILEALGTESTKFIMTQLKTLPNLDVQLRYLDMVNRNSVRMFTCPNTIRMWQKQTQKFNATIKGISQFRSFFHFIKDEGLSKPSLMKALGCEGMGFPQLDEIVDTFSSLSSDLPQDISYDGVFVHSEEELSKVSALFEEKKKFENRQDSILADLKRALGVKQSVKSIKMNAAGMININKKYIPAMKKQYHALGFSRIKDTVYSSNEVIQLNQDIIKLNNRIESVLHESTQLWLQRLLLYLPTLRSAIEIVSNLDCLLSIVEVTFNRTFFESTTQRRPILMNQERSALQFKDALHPCVSDITNYIANSIQIGSFEGETPSPRTMILTGPNMAGKSTLLRQTAVNVILAQIGCYPFAASTKLVPIHSIQSRLGASDHLLLGESTFAVECNETSRILETATPRSLVLMDELGRGTSTTEGFALSAAVLEHCTRRISPLLLYSTHFQEQAQLAFKEPALFAAYKMGYQLFKENGLVFTYQLTRGVSQFSFGINAARHAGIQKHMLTFAQQLVDASYKDAMKQEESSSMENRMVDDSSDFIDDNDDNRFEKPDASTMASFLLRPNLANASRDRLIELYQHVKNTYF